MIIIVIGGFPLCPASALPPAAGPRIILSQSEVAPGHTLLLEVDTSDAPRAYTRIELSYNEITIPVIEHPSGIEGKFIGLIPIPLSAKPAKNVVLLKFSDKNSIHTKAVAFTIVSNTFATEELRIDPAMIILSDDDRRRVEREWLEVKEIYTDKISARLWREPFQMPLAGGVTSAFGTKRVFNGTMVSIHSGVDLRSDIGTPVFAANQGVVKLAKELFYAGNCVVIDHGMNIFTVYAHLSVIQVAAGQSVCKGQQLGLSGATGRVNGPHLHWGARVGGIKVCPIQLSDVIRKLSEI